MSATPQHPITTPETLEQFYRHKFDRQLPLTPQGMGHFNVFRLEDCLAGSRTTLQYSRRDFYKITLVRGRYRYHYADKSLELDGQTLLFFNPQTPYTWEFLGGDATGFFCIFSHAFYNEVFNGKGQEGSMYQVGGKPAYTVTDEQEKEIVDVFNRMFREIGSEYPFKYNLLQNYVMELSHLALKSEPAEALYQHPNARLRITAVFSELLERQFPIDNPAQRFSMRSASQYADQLAVHVNYLNRAVKETTGKTTTALIQERLLGEAKLLLHHTGWNVSEIAYCLGFEDPAHFSNFFRKQARVSPVRFRNTALVAG